MFRCGVIPSRCILPNRVPYPAPHDGSAIGVGAEIDGAAHGRCPIFHEAQAKPFMATDSLGQAAAIIGNFQNETVILAPEADLDLMRLTVAECVGDRFLRDAKEVRGDKILFDDDGIGTRETAFDVIDIRGAGRQVVEADHEPVGSGVHRLQSARDLAGLVFGLVQHCHDLSGDLRLLQLFFGEVFVEQMRVENDAGDLLAESIMQVSADPLLLAFADLKDLPIESLLLRDLPFPYGATGR